MATTVEVRDLGDAIEKLQRRIRDLEQRGTTAILAPPPIMPANPVFTTVTINGVLQSTVTTPPTVLSATPGVFLNNIYIDVGWVASATAERYQIEVAQKIAGVYQAPTQYTTAGTNIRIDGLAPDTIYGIRVYGINRLGLISSALPSVGYNDYTTGHDSTTPSAITGFTVTAGFRSVVAVWANSPDFDFDYFNLQISTSNTFPVGPTTRTAVVRGSIGGFTDLVGATLYYLRVQSVDKSGNVGAYTAAASVTTGIVIVGDIPPFFIDNAMIATAAITTAKIGLLQVTDAIIASLSATKLNVTGTMTSTDFQLGSGGQIKTATITPGFILNNQGFSLYDASAHRTVYLDATTGAAYFEGTLGSGTLLTAPVISGGTIIGSLFKTANSGQRIEMSTSPINRIKFFTGLTNELNPGLLEVMGFGSGATERGLLQLVSPSMVSNASQAGFFAYSGNATDPAQASIGAGNGNGLSLDSTYGGNPASFMGYGEAMYLRAGYPPNAGPWLDGILWLDALNDIKQTAGRDITLTALDDIFLTASDLITLTSTNDLRLDGARTIVGTGSPTYSGAEFNVMGLTYMFGEMSIFGNKITVYDSGYGITINGTDADKDNLKGSWGGGGGGIRGRTGHTLSYEWDGTNIKLYIDNVLEVTL